MRWQIILSCLLLLVSFPLFGQLDSAAKVDVIKSLSLFRSELLKDTNNVIAYGVVVHENAKLNWDSLNYRHTIYVNDDLSYNFPEYNRLSLANRYGNNSILTQMNIDVQKIYYDNRYLASANYYGLVENAYPFNIKKKLDLFDELEFYKIQAGDTILDYYSGFYCFAPMLCSIYPNLLIHLFVPFFESEEYKEKYFIRSFNSFKDSSRTEFTSTHLKKNKTPSLQYNKLFLNSPIGYYDSPIKLLKQARKLVRSNGNLFFAQYAIWMHNQYAPPYRYSTNKLNRILSKSGLKIVETLTLESETIYKCEKIDSK